MPSWGLFYYSNFPGCQQLFPPVHSIFSHYWTFRRANKAVKMLQGLMAQPYNHLRNTSSDTAFWHTVISHDCNYISSQIDPTRTWELPSGYHIKTSMARPSKPSHSSFHHATRVLHLRQPQKWEGGGLVLLVMRDHVDRQGILLKTHSGRAENGKGQNAAQVTAWCPVTGVLEWWSIAHLMELIKLHCSKYTSARHSDKNPLLSFPVFSPGPNLLSSFPDTSS